MATIAFPSECKIKIRKTFADINGVRVEFFSPKNCGLLSSAGYILINWVYVDSILKGFNSEGIQYWNYSILKGFKSEGIQIWRDPNMKGFKYERIQFRRDSIQKGFNSEGIQFRRDSIPKGFNSEMFQTFPLFFFSFCLGCHALFCPTIICYLQVW